MWKVLGEETVLVNAGEVWRNRLLELSKRRKEREKFQKLLREGEARHLFDSSRDIHVFIIELPEKVETQDIQFMADYITKLQKAAKKPLIEFDGVPQPHAVIITSEPKQDDYETRKKRRAEEKRE